MASRLALDCDSIAARYRSGESVASIAADLGCSCGPIYARLFDVGVLRSRRARIDVERLEYMYVTRRLSAAAIAAELGYSQQTIRRHLTLAGIPLRSHAESLQPTGRRPCPNSAPYRAYALGFVWGDMAAERLWESGETVAVRGSTTKSEQLSLVRDLFGDFGLIRESVGARSTCVRVSLDLTFAFLLDKYGESVPHWVNGVVTEAAFAAGYIDAEGSFGIYEGRARFKLDSYDGAVHDWLRNWLRRIGVRARTRIVARSGEPRKARPVWPRDLWRTNVNDALSLRRLVATIEPFSRHAQRQATMTAAAANVLQRMGAR